MKQGLVEINTTGSISDFDDVILITREQVEHVNELVKVSAFYEGN
jgi:predicted DNA-binding ArsR family transcriptional regulator